MVRVWKTKSLLFCLRYDPLIVFRRQNHITFNFIKTMSHDLLVQIAYCMITTLGANSSTTHKSYSLVLEPVLPPIPCHLMSSRSSSKLKLFAMCVLKLRWKKSWTRRMKEWPRIKTRISGMRKREYIQRKYLPENVIN